MSPGKSCTGSSTLLIALFLLVTMSLCSAFVALPQRPSHICFLHATWHKVSYRGYSPSCLLPPVCVHLSTVVMFFSVSIPMNSIVFLGFSSTFLMSVNFIFGTHATISVFVMFHRVHSISASVLARARA